MTTANTERTDYYQRVARYYDVDAANFEERYWANPVLQRIRQSFREVVKTHPFEQVLEIGCGTGIDLAHFGSIFPERRFYGIDVSPAMVAHAATKINDLKLDNVMVKVGTPEQLAALFPAVRFDLIYVFFGALNTVEDLQQLEPVLKKCLQPQGTMVLTFVNKWYLADIVINLAKGRFRRAFRRSYATWDGYSDTKKLESRCLSPLGVKRALGREFDLTLTRGYSIFYPAWYRSGLVRRLGARLCEAFWNLDGVLNHTPAWSLGEYALYTFKTRN